MVGLKLNHDSKSGHRKHYTYFMEYAGDQNCDIHPRRSRAVASLQSINYSAIYRVFGAIGRSVYM